MPYPEGFGGYTEVTIYGLMITVHPPEAMSGIMFFTQTLSVLLSFSLALIAFQQHHRPVDQRQPALIIIIIYPVIIAPLTLLHDLVILIPAVAIWADQAPSSWLF
jgi:hypothetical protein